MSNRFRMTLPEWQTNPPTNHDLICGCSVDGVDELVAGLRNDPYVSEPIGAATGFRNHYRQSWLRPSSSRDLLVVTAFNEKTDHRRRGNAPIHRVRIARTLKDAGFRNKKLKPLQFWQKLGRSHFCISPEGNGVDCHRTYEAIYLGAIPIVEDRPQIREKLAGLPVLFTRDYREITKSYLDAKLPQFLEATYDFSVVVQSTHSPPTQALLNRRSSFWHTVNKAPLAASSPGTAKPNIAPTATLVTALADIGVDQGSNAPSRYQVRSMKTYQEWMRPILAINQPMVIYTDADRADWIRAERAHASPTQVHVFSPTELPYYPRLKNLMPNFSRQVRRPDRPEVTIPAYNALMFQKISWVAQAARDNPFSTNNFLWIDAGLGHGNLPQVAPKVDFRHWPSPAALADWPDDRLRMLALGKLKPLHSSDWPHVLDAHENAIAGNCWGGSATAIAAAAELWPRLIDHTLEAGLLDDDQAIWRLLYSIYPSLFHLESKRNFWGGISRDWYHLVKSLGASR